MKEQLLVDAARSGDTVEVRRLLLNGADPNDADLEGRTPLHDVCRNGHDQVAILLLEYGANPNIATKDGETPLHAASECSISSSTAKLLKERAKTDPNQRTNNGRTPLHTACEKGNVEVIKLLLEYEADPMATDNDGRTPLHAVCENGDERIADLLLEWDPTHKVTMLNATDKVGRTPLHTACDMLHYRLVKLLLIHGGNSNAKTFSGWTPLHAACRNGPEPSAIARIKVPPSQSKNGQNLIVNLLLQCNANPNATDCYGWTPLHEACKNGLDSNIVKLLLQHEAKPNATTKNGTTVLHEACKLGYEVVVTMLLNHGASPNVADKNGWTPLHEACKNGHGRVVTLLMERNADPNTFDVHGRTPLHEACNRGHDLIVTSLLLDYGVNPNHMDNYGGTSLHAACENLEDSVVESLLQHGANPNAANKDGWTPLHETCKTGQESVAALLLAKEAFPNAMSNDGWTPLHEACKRGHDSMVTLLWHYGVNPNVTNNDGWTPLFEACKNGQDAIVKLLLKHGASPNAVERNCRNELTPFDIAGRHGQTSVKSLLLQYQASSKVANNGVLTKNDFPKAAKYMDKVLRDLKEDAGMYTVYTATLDAMNDNLVAEALASGISVNEIAHAMFACEESRTWLYNFLVEYLQTNSVDLVNSILDVFYLKNVSNKQHEALDLADYIEVSSLYVEEGRMKARKHLNGVYQLVGECFVFALVPYKEGVKIYRRKDCSTPVKDTWPSHVQLQTLGNGGSRAQVTIDQLVELGCDKVLAWRLLTAAAQLRNPSVDDVCDTVIQSFRVVSKFRTQLRVAIKCQSQHGAKMLLGSQDELWQNRKVVDERFVVDRSMYTTAQRMSCNRDDANPLEPLTIEFLELDALKTHMDLLSKLIERAKNSDVNKGKTKQDRSRLDARSVAFLGALGGKVKGSAVSNYVQSQYCYQDDNHTKGLCTPFSNLIVVATANRLVIEVPKQVQSLPNASLSVNNWVALRAAFEFDIKTGKFRYGTPEFQQANALIKNSMVDFINDASRRFCEVFEASPDLVYVSHLESLCDEIAERTGASSPWLVREMISRYIAKGARIRNSSSTPKDGYGRMETDVCHANCRLPFSTKVLVFDRRVNVAGVVCRVSANGKVSVRPATSDARRVLLRFKYGRDAPDYETAKQWLSHGLCESIVLVAPDLISGTEWAFGDHHVVETNYV